MDNNATTPLHPKVKETIVANLDNFGNPSSIHQIGREMNYKIENARKEIADFLNCDPSEIIFTAGGSEGNNTVLKSFAANCCGHACTSKSHIITTAVEHPSVLNTLEAQAKANNADVTFLPVDEYGMVSVEDVKNAIRPETKLISIMYANNEIGTIMPIEEIADIAKEKGIPFHTDAVQAVGKVDIDLQKLPVDFLTLSGHKLHAPKGIGVLFKRRGTKSFCPLISGGHQENAQRAGTENTLGILALAEAFKQLKLEMNEEIPRLKKLRDRLQQGVMKNLKNVKLNGHPEKRLPGTVNLSFNDVEGEAILLRLDFYDVAISTGSACSSGSLDPSHVLMALGVDPEVAHSSIRFSLGRDNTEEEVDKVIEAVTEVITFLRKISPIG
jgi:cysteine desulfurase